MKGPCERRKTGALPSHQSSRRIAWYCAGFEIRCPRDSGVRISPTAPLSVVYSQGRLLKLNPSSWIHAAQFAWFVFGGLHGPCWLFRAFLG